MSSEDPESTIPWPGFVDILSTVIIVFVFFMMLTSVIIFMMSKQQQEQMLDELANKAAEAREAGKQEVLKTIALENTVDTEGVPTGVPSLDIQQVLEENVKLKQQVAKMVQVKTVASKSEQQSLQKINAKTVLVDYGDFGVTIKDNIAAQLKEYLPYTGVVRLEAVVPAAGNFGATREIALNRALNIRNILIQNGVPANKINFKIMPAAADQDNGEFGYVRVIFTQ